MVLREPLQEGANMKILIADDRTEVGLLFKTIILRAFPDCKIDLAEDGEEAIKAFRTGNHDALLLDIRMPKKNGCEVYWEIKEIALKEKLKMPFVIFCSGYSLPEELDKITADTSNCAILKKPVTSKELISILTNASSTFK